METRDRNGVGGELTITRKEAGTGRVIEVLGPFRNKVVSSSGYGRNLIARKLAGDNTYDIAITSMSAGTNSAAATDADTDLGTPTVTGLEITSAVASNDIVVVEVFVPDANLPDDSYDEIGFFCAGRMLSRVVLSPAYSKSAGEDTLFSYTLTLTSS